MTQIVEVSLLSKNVYPAWLREALPDRLRRHARTLPRSPESNQLTIVFELPDQTNHTIDIFLMSPGKGAFKTISSVGFSYRAFNKEGTTSNGPSFCEMIAETLHDKVGGKLEKYLKQEVRNIDKRVELFFDQYRLGETGLEALIRQLRQTHGSVDSVELFLISPCVQSCSFCVYPLVRGTSQDLQPVGDTVEWIRVILSELRTREVPGDIILSGPDIFGHPKLNGILELFTEEHEVGLCFLGPMTLCNLEVVPRLASLPSLRSIRLSLFGARPETHDAVVGTPGAYAHLMSVILEFHRHGIPVALNTVITPENVSELPEILSKLADIASDNHYYLTIYDPQSWIWSNPPISWRKVSLDRVVVNPNELYSALERSRIPEDKVLQACPIPRCWIPEKWRKTITWDFGESDNTMFLQACEDCSARSSCPGILEPALEVFGAECARPIE